MSVTGAVTIIARDVPNSYILIHVYIYLLLSLLASVVNASLSNVRDR